MAKLMIPTGLIRPEVMEVVGVPELVCDLALVEPHRDMVRIMLCMERNAGTVVDLVGRLHMPMSGFIRSKLLERAAELKAALNSVQ